MEEELSQEILAEILLRLPAEPLIEVKSVSKQWNSIITDPGFTQSQLKRSMSLDLESCTKILLIGNLLESISIQSIIASDADALKTIKLDSPVNIDEETVIAAVGSCNGLVCLLVDSEHLVLWNPTTKESRNIPKSEFAPSPDVQLFHGLGYDAKTNDYKLVRGYSADSRKGSGPSHMMIIEIFSLMTNSWRKVQYEGIKSIGTNTGAYAKGYLHWLRNNEIEPVNEIVSFNLYEESFHETALMTGVNDYEKVPLEGLCVRGECLLVYRGIEFGDRFKAWVTKWEEGKESLWTMVCTVSRDELPYNKYWLNPIDFTLDGKVLFDSGGWELCLYDQKANAVIKSMDLGCDWYFYGSITYVQSLVSPFRSCK